VRGFRSLAGSCAAGLALAAGAGAQEGPSALGSARLGTLTVTSRVILGATSADLRGVWTDTKVPCSAKRRLRVVAEIDYVPFGGSGRRFVRRGTFADANCAEGGPNVGFTIRARSTPFACPSGRWRRGRYTFVVKTTEPKRGLRATADLDWTRTARC
jgi:hypothetical protein